MKLVIDDKIPYIREAAARLGEARYLPGAAIGPDDVREADVLIVRTRTRCDEALLGGSRVRLVVTATIGYDHLDTAYLDRAGIAWANCPGCNAASVAQYVESALLLLAADGAWGPANARATSAEALVGSLGRRPVVGIVGVGHVGRRVAAMARRLGFGVLLCDPPRVAARDFDPGQDETDFADLGKLEREADVITFHTPLTDEGPYATRHLADDAFFRRLARRPVIINTSRGEVVETRALLCALEARRVGRAVIDTWEDEPLIDRRLLRAAFLATPHIAGYSADGKACGTAMALEAVARHFGLDARFDIRPPRVPQDYCYHPAANDNPAYSLAPLRLYDPRRDSEALKARPERFEWLRGHYPLRRERFD